MKIHCTCPMCKTERKVEVNFADYAKWVDGATVQSAFPYLSADDREALISGICPTCWDKMFPEDDEED